MRVQPKEGKNWDAIDSDLFFDQGQIVMEINGLELAGKGSITDPESGETEEVSLRAPIDLC